MATRGGFTKRLIRELGYPYTIHNRRAFASWMQSEGGKARFNPLNTTKLMPGSTSYNDVGVQNYASLDDGVKATADTLRENQRGYDRIRRCLRLNYSAKTTVSAMGDSAWGTGKTLMLIIVAEISRVPSVLRRIETTVIG